VQWHGDRIGFFFRFFRLKKKKKKKLSACRGEGSVVGPLLAVLRCVAALRC
jgi:hypothetical protein